MLPPSPMLAKINYVRSALCIMALALWCGCTPAGPRALLKGKRCLDRGEVAAAVVQFQRATALLPANANAWNYLGVACQRAGQAEAAANAYQKALRLDRDLAEVHYNLGVLCLEQNRPDLAKNELTAYTLRRPNDARGWLKLGYALLRGGDLPTAERSFATVLALKTDDAEAYNGLGLSRLQAGKARDAAQFFAAAVQARPNFAAALQNLATVDLQYLHDNKSALTAFQAYLNLVPRPTNYNEVRNLVTSLTQSEVPAAGVPIPALLKTSAPPQEPKPKAMAPAPPRFSSAEDSPTGHPVAQLATSPESVVPLPTQTVHVRPEPILVVSPKTNRPVQPAMVAESRPKSKIITKAPTTNMIAAAEPLEVQAAGGEPPRAGFLHRLFQGDTPPGTSSAKRFREDTAAPIPPPEAAPAPKTVSDANSASSASPASPPVSPASTATPSGATPGPPPTINRPRYAYVSPAKPTSGDRQGAQKEFTRARQAEQNEDWAAAEQGYQKAADRDPSWFEAQYNAGVAAHQLHQYAAALPRYELALAIQPASVDARYSFAQALRAAGYAFDAADQLKQVLAAKPNEVRAHLALANVCAQVLHDVAQAKLHYVRVLELQPDNPHATDIRFWLAANSDSKKTP